MEEKEYPTPTNLIPIEKQTEYYYDTGEKMLIKGYKDMTGKELSATEITAIQEEAYYIGYTEADKKFREIHNELVKVIDMMAEDLVKVPEYDGMPDVQLSIVRAINADLNNRKEDVKEYYFKKARGE